MIYVFTGQAQNLLSGKFQKYELAKILIDQDKWVLFSKITDRVGWAKADSEMMKAYVKKAETYLNYEWPGIPATKSLLIERTGDRDEYQKISFEKRGALGTVAKPGELVIHYAPESGKAIGITAVLLIISIGNYSRISSDGSIRAVEFISIRVIGALSGLLIFQIAKVIKER